MIKLFRIDHRLLHGQVAFSWTKSIGADCILVADDEATTNSLKMTTLRLAKPQGVKLVVKSIDDSIKALQSGVTDKYKLFIVTAAWPTPSASATPCPRSRASTLAASRISEGSSPGKPGRSSFFRRKRTSYTSWLQTASSSRFRQVPNGEERTLQVTIHARIQCGSHARCALRKKGRTYHDGTDARASAGSEKGRVRNPRSQCLQSLYYRGCAAGCR